MRLSVASAICTRDKMTVTCLQAVDTDKLPARETSKAFWRDRRLTERWGDGLCGWHGSRGLEDVLKSWYACRNTEGERFCAKYWGGAAGLRNSPA